MEELRKGQAGAAAKEKEKAALVKPPRSLLISGLHFSESVGNHRTIIAGIWAAFFQERQSNVVADRWRGWRRNCAGVWRRANPSRRYCRRCVACRL